MKCQRLGLRLSGSSVQLSAALLYLLVILDCFDFIPMIPHLCVHPFSPSSPAMLSFQLTVGWFYLKVLQGHWTTRDLCEFIVCLLGCCHVWLSVTLQTVAHQAPLSVGFSRQGYALGCHALLQETFPTQGSNLHLLHCRQILDCWAAGEVHEFVS